MHWCYLPSLDDSSDASEYYLDGEEAHHALKVMRLKTGDPIDLFNGRGSVVRARITATEGSKALWAEIEQRHTKTAELPDITLALAIPKGGNMELIVQKAVELGVSRIIPIVSERCIVRLKAKDAAAKQEKWQRIALEACKQCKAAYLPEVAAVRTLEEHLREQHGKEARLCCALVAAARPLRERLEELRAKGEKAVTLLVGPEGDFTEGEYSSIMDVGYKPVSLGSLILRVETAVFMALASARYALDGEK